VTAPAYLFIGIDPGPTPGIVLITTAYDRIDNVRIVQCSSSALWIVLGALDPNRIAAVQVERFVARGRMTADQRETADQVAQIEQLYTDVRPIATRTANQVKPWATDERLEAAHLAEHLKGMRHARDAARHSLYLAVHSGAIHDPLSRRSR
jgi:hypothetical protein